MMPHKSQPWGGFSFIPVGFRGTFWGKQEDVRAQESQHTAAVTMWDEMEESASEKIQWKSLISADLPG